jgi:hypothetical protein
MRAVENKDAGQSIGGALGAEGPCAVAGKLGQEWLTETCRVPSGRKILPGGEWRNGRFCRPNSAPVIIYTIVFI